MHLDLLRSFQVVLEERSLNRASVRLHVAQSTLTRQMKTLEQEMGGLLLERTASGVSPTAAGQLLASQVKEALARMDAMIDETRKVAKGQRLQLRVGYLLSAGASYLNPALAALRKAHPEVQVKLLDLSPGEQIQALQRGDIDVALVGQEGEFAAGDFYTRRIATLPVYAALPADHELSARSALRLTELRGLSFIGTPEEHVPGRDQWIIQLCRREGFRPRFTQASDSLGHALSMVVSEGAVALVPGYVAESPVPGVVFRQITDPGVNWDFLVVWQRGRLSAPLKVLLQSLPGESRAA